jgi:hypothetical protein
MNTFPTRALAIDFLESKELPRAMAKVAIKETFDLGPDVPADDLCYSFDGTNLKVINVTEQQCLDAYNNVIGHMFDVDEKGISIYGELKYDLNGDLYMDDHQKPEQPTQPEQTAPAPTTQQ